MATENTVGRSRPSVPRLPGFRVCEDSGKFVTRRPVTEKQLIEVARRLIDRRISDYADALTDPQLVREFLKLHIGDREREVFFVLFLNNQHCVIAAEEMFQGSIDGASVYPREVVKRALQLNAGAVILAHNHPSGSSNPSGADKQLTERLKNALGLVDIRVLDHFIVGEGIPFSFAEHGLI